jgi:hypothetical protein
MLQFPRKGEREYITTIDIAAVFIAVTDGGCMVRASRDLEASERTLREECPGFCMVAAWWVKDRETADQIAGMVRTRAPHLHRTELELRQRIAAAAASQAVKLTEHATVMKRVVAAARRVEDALQAANGRGELAWFNRAYRDYRLSGQRRLSYGEARGRLRRAMIRRLVLVERVEYGPDLLAEVFSTAK